MISVVFCLFGAPHGHGRQAAIGRLVWGQVSIGVGSGLAYCQHLRRSVRLSDERARAPQTKPKRSGQVRRLPSIRSSEQPHALRIPLRLQCARVQSTNIAPRASAEGWVLPRLPEPVSDRSRQGCSHLAHCARPLLPDRVGAGVTVRPPPSGGAAAMRVATALAAGKACALRPGMA